MSMEFYKILHLTGIFMVMISLGAFISQYKTAKSKEIADKKSISITHGIGLILALVGGFGLMARLSVPWDGWIITKIILWFVLGGITVLIKKSSSKMASIWWMLLIAICAFVVYLVRMRPY